VMISQHLEEVTAQVDSIGELFTRTSGLLAPIGSQEVWAAGVTYHRAHRRMEESQTAGGGDFYDRVYASPASGALLQIHCPPCGWSGQLVRIAATRLECPEPELALVVTSSSRIVGFTIGMT